MTDMAAPRTSGALIHDTGRECDGEPGTEMPLLRRDRGAVRVRRDLLRGLLALPAPRRAGQRRSEVGPPSDLLRVVPESPAGLRTQTADRRVSVLPADLDAALYAECIPHRISRATNTLLGPTAQFAALAIAWEIDEDDEAVA